MNFISAKEFSERESIGLRTVQNMCRAGKIPGACKISNVWMIPSDYILGGESGRSQSKTDASSKAGKPQDALPAEVGTPLGKHLAYFLQTGRLENFLRDFEEIYSRGDELTKARCLALRAYKYYPKLELMADDLDRAYEALQGTDKKVDDLSLTLGGHMLLGVFLRRGGKADDYADVLEQKISSYERLKGYKSGVDILFRAELEYMRGNINQSEFYAYKCYYLNSKDSEIKLGLGYLFSHLGLYFHNEEEVDIGRRLFNEVERECRGEIIKTAVSLARCELYLIVSDFNNVPDWIKKGNFVTTSLTFTSRLNAIYLHLSYLLYTGEYARVAALSEKLIEETRTTAKDTSYYSSIYLNITAAIACYAMNLSDQGDYYLKETVELTKLDRLIMPLVDYSILLGDKIEAYLSKNEPEIYKKYCSIKEKFNGNRIDMLEQFKKADVFDSLTQTEKNVACLICDGMSNAEIAEKLFVSISTVNYHIRNIYSKLGVRRRTEMIKALGKLPQMLRGME